MACHALVADLVTFGYDPGRSNRVAAAPMDPTLAYMIQNGLPLTRAVDEPQLARRAAEAMVHRARAGSAGVLARPRQGRGGRGVALPQLRRALDGRNGRRAGLPWRRL